MSAHLPNDPVQQPEGKDRMKAAYLWSVLDMIHADLNALCRRNPRAQLSPMSIKTINRAFGEIEDLLAPAGLEDLVGMLDADEPPAHDDALVALALYRSALRRFRIEALGENPYSI